MIIATQYKGLTIEYFAGTTTVSDIFGPLMTWRYMSEMEGKEKAKEFIDQYKNESNR